MKPKLPIIGWFIFALLSSAATLADAPARAYVDRTQVAPGESLQLSVTLNGDGTVDISPIQDFKVLSQGTNTSMQIINGRATRQVTYIYLLIPQREGQLTIPALPVKVDSRKLQTQPITITVSSQPPTEADSQSRQVWVEASLSPQKPYVGQQIIYTFKLYNAVQVTDAKFEPPEFKGFSAKEVEKRRSFRKEIKGREHIVTEVTYVLVPLQAGVQTIDSATLQVGVVRPEQQRRRSFGFDTFFNDPFFNRIQAEPRVLQSQPLTVQVRPLPSLPGSDLFSGLVGRFDLAATLENPNLNVGQSTTLIVTVQGQGNIMDAQAPQIEVPPIFKTYADAPQEEIRLDHTGYAGKKIFRTALVPLQAGTFELPPVRLIYFDVAQEAYRTLTSPALTLTVQATQTAQAAPVTITPAPLAPLKKKVEFSGRDILPPKENLDALTPQRPLSVFAFLLWLAGPPVAFTAVLWVQRLQRRDPSPAAVMRVKARQALKMAQTATDRNAFLSSLYRALAAAIHAVAGRTGEALTWKEAQVILLQNGYAEESARQAAELLARIESNKFSGAALSQDQCNDLLAQTRKMVRKLVP